MASNVVALRTLSKLPKYDAAIRAVEQAATIDEVKDLDTIAAMMEAYGRQMKDKQIERNGWAIRQYAKLRSGELMEQQRKAEKLNKGGRRTAQPGSSKDPVGLPTLAEVGFTKRTADAARKAAAKPAEFKEMVEAVRRGEPASYKPTPRKTRADADTEAGLLRSVFLGTVERAIAEAHEDEDLIAVDDEILAAARRAARAWAACVKRLEKRHGQKNTA